MNGKPGRTATGRPTGVRLRPKHQEDVRLKIKAALLVNRLQAIALNELKNDRTGEVIAVDFTSQLKAIEILLRKILPDLSKTEHSGTVTLEQLVIAARSNVAKLAVSTAVGPLKDKAA